ncbi:DUF1801 domain-containing protein [Gammaproteobacteria bacterium]|nr:DUF1801 domain-containing protein [Gammaproteobacteria bacterium]
MDISSVGKVNDFLSDIQRLSTDQFELAMAIRRIFLTADENLVEEIKYGGLTFKSSNALVGGIYVYKAHVSIEFSNGADFIDPNSILEGSGKKRRHMKIFNNDDITNKNVHYYVNQAVAR